MAALRDNIVQDDWGLGSVLSVARHLIPENGAREITNGILDEDGSAVRRGGTSFVSTAATFNDFNWVWAGFFAAGQRTLAADDVEFVVLDDDGTTLISLGNGGVDFPPTFTEIAGMLFIGGGFIYAGSRKAADYSAGTVALTNGSTTVTGTTTLWVANADAGMLFQRGNERVYPVASVDSDTQITLAEPYEGSTGSGISYTLNNLYQITAADPYPIAEHYATVANRLVFAEDRKVHISAGPDPGGSGIGKPHDFLVKVGDDDVPQTHELPEGADVRGLAAIQQILLVFTNQGTWTLEGLAFDIVDPTGNPQHRLQRLSDVRLWGAPGSARWEQTYVVPGFEGMWLMDGVSSPRKLSDNVDPRYRDYVERGFRPGQATVFQGHYLLPVLSPVGNVEDVLVSRLDRPIQVRGRATWPWFFFDGFGAEVRAYANRTAPTTPQAELIAAGNGGRILDCTKYFDPGVEAPKDADGSDFELDIETRDYETGNQTLNSVRHVRTRYQFVGDEAVGGASVELSHAIGEVNPALPYWGHPDGEWGAGFAGDDGQGAVHPWGSAVEASWLSLCAIRPDPTGMRPQRCRVGRHARFIRYRLRQRGETELLKIRSLETQVRPAGSRRR